MAESGCVCEGRVALLLAPPRIIKSIKSLPLTGHALIHRDRASYPFMSLSQDDFLYSIVVFSNIYSRIETDI